MKDYTTVPLTPFSPKDRQAYFDMVMREAASRHDPVLALYARYKTLPADVAANLVHLDMQKPGWNAPPRAIIDRVAAELPYVKHFFRFLANPKQPGIDPDEYVDEENWMYVYAALIKCCKDDDRAKQAEAAAAFCKGTQGASPCLR